MLKRLDDFRLDLVENTFSTASKEIFRLLRDLPKDKSSQTYQRLLNLLANLRTFISGWSSTYLPRAYRDKDVNQLLENKLPISELNDTPVMEIASEMRSSMDKALSSVQSFISKVRIGEVEPPIQTAVSLIGKDGKSRRFELSYYATLVAQNSLQRSIVAATLERSREMSNDSIQVSPLLSNYENACDYYAGNVFSISGKSKAYPALSSIPSLPFHPFCLYTLDLYLSKDKKENTVPKWAFLKSKREDFSDVISRMKEIANG